MRSLLPWLGLALGLGLLAGPLNPRLIPEPDVIFIVTDTVRSDHLSLCGYGRPTSPELQALADRPGVLHTCDAHAPGSWTLPSHASFFTGVSPLEHGAHAIISGVKDPHGVGVRVRPLDGALPTLAERFDERGYQTVAISANPVLSESMGLLRGFAVHQVSGHWGRLFGEALPKKLDKTLGTEWDGHQPLFLFVNIGDAHQPWGPDKAEDIPWDSPDIVRHKYDKREEDGVWQRYVRGQMSPAQAEALREEVRDAYDVGVLEADHNIARVLEVARERGVCRGPCRVIITSDHGEMLGEHQLLDHGHYLWETTQRVPVIAWGVTGPLPQQMNAQDVHALVLHGHMPSTPTPPVAEAWPHVRRCARTQGLAFCDTWVATWHGDTKLLWRDGEVWQEDLATDPAEARRLPVTNPEWLEALSARGERVKRAERADDKVDEDVIDVLKAFGYFD